MKKRKKMCLFYTGALLPEIIDPRKKGTENSVILKWVK
jgi:hypothetical protein